MSSVAAIASTVSLPDINPADFSGNFIRKGSRGPLAREVQAALQALGIDPGPIDGIVGPKTDAAVRAFQRAYGCTLVDGIVGPQTWQALLGGEFTAAGAGFVHPVPGGAYPTDGAVSGASRSGGARTHVGVDFSFPSGTPIQSFADGEIVNSGWLNDLAGWGVEIDHGNGVFTRYLHLSGDPRDWGFTAGTQVSAGDTIGYVGSTGTSSGPHLHDSMRVNGSDVDPMLFLGMFD